MIRTRFAAALAIPMALSGCATEYGTAVGSFGQMQVKTASDADVWIVRFTEFQKVYPHLPATVPIGDNDLPGLLKDAPSGRPNQGEFLYRAGRYFLSFRCGNVQHFKPITVRSGDTQTSLNVSCA
jgi:hypothetical protein